ncbi:hypothetical protein TVAG_232680 [Trichomonas vaginalis G3]|uniref:Rab3 GTPase-activating protein catalytic subunit n=1 Tax=Trichomonas vaginalis (strain ATCC PRA-98 / G3) TaxID=412133 RepID=A2EU98_TRIV3|nr:positive regulation of glutamate neurotransmitter secretion in response to membrane depolarization [Trichomonas vaginalis G3]EAY03785.1 hypothetical protein TVAG_232680 [Trichomonas vaginalis G3]KAI5494238.1 positive regulation of glutamate neurotransmitter secretion in response to membrane depolarization [Trichomonas vaginalis G3]|eukprot:XP_001316008.1 hypothetical protein [Trichomonas vaginalis G3]
MSNFEHVELEALWSDFTKATPMEESISTVEIAIREMLNKNDIIHESRFAYHGKYYTIKYFPADFSVETDAFKLTYTPVPVINLIRKYFGVEGGLFVIFSAKSIDSAHKLMSVLTPAISDLGTCLPIFVHIPSGKYHMFLGFSFNEHVHTHMSCKIDWSEKTVFSDFDSILKTFKECTGVDNCPITANSSIFFDIGKNYFGPNSKYTQNEFYSKIVQDPIDNIKIALLTTEVKNPEKDFSLNDVKHIAIAMNRNTSETIYQESGLTRFVKFIKHTEFMQEFTNHAPTQATKIVDDIFASAKVGGEKSVLKAAPADSILTKITIAMASAPEIHLASSIWSTFLSKIRNCYDKKILIPGVGTDAPDFEHCLLYQKIQMINYCIAQGKNSDRKFTNSEPTNKKLLNGKPMINPSLQTVASARTEDQLREDEQLLLNNYEDQLQKSRIQSKQLRSDIAAFKAENEGSVFEDFVRWFSPTDYNEETGEMTSRMSDPRNFWRDLWEAEVPKLAKDQDPTFDATMQAELALDYLSSAIPTEVFGDLVPVLLSAAYFAIKNDYEINIPIISDYISDVKDVLDQFHKEVDLFNNNDQNMNIIEYIKICNEKFTKIEEICAKLGFFKSILQKLPGCYRLLHSLCFDKFCVVTTPEEKKAASDLMKDLKVDEMTNRRTVEFCFQKESQTGKNRLYTEQYFDNMGYLNHVFVATTIEEYL